MKSPKTDLLQGTLDLLILRTLASGDMHGWGISQRPAAAVAGRPAGHSGDRSIPRCTGSNRLVELRQQAPRLGIDNAGLSVKEIADYRAQTHSLDALVEYHQMAFPCLGPASRAAAIDPMRALRAD